MKLKFFTFCFSKKLIWRNEKNLRFILSLFFISGDSALAAWVLLARRNRCQVGDHYCVICLKLPHPKLPPSEASCPWRRSWQENRCGKTQSRGTIREKTSRKTTDEKRWWEDWKANVILSLVTNWIYILDSLPVHTQYFAGARNKLQTLQKSLSYWGRHRILFLKPIYTCLFKQSLNATSLTVLKF